MSKQGVERVIAALLSDSRFYKAFFSDKKKTLDECGFALNEAEMKTLLSIEEQDIRVSRKPAPPWEVVIPVRPEPPEPPGKNEV